MQGPLFNSEIRISVAQFNELINRHLKDLGEIIIEGEVTTFSKSPKGGVNITLKDKNENALVNISGYAPRIEGLDLIETNIEVAVWGFPEIYSPYGKFSVSIHKILPLGEGALSKAFEKLKAKLQEEGLFNEERKRELPKLIERIAVVSAKDSAAMSDFLKIIKENKLHLDIDFYPVAVQGKYSVKEINSTLKKLNKKQYDCVVLIRGGGSLEDLSSFNDETVARSVFQSKNITLVAVGHEKDESIAELAADIRASTPSQAAYYLVSNRENFINSLDVIVEHIHDQVSNILSHYEGKISVADPFQIIQKILFQTENKILKYDFDISDRLVNRIRDYELSVQKASSELKNFEKYLTEIRSKIYLLDKLFLSLNPQNVLGRGYAIIKKDNNIISSVKKLKVTDKINIRLKDGELTTIIKNIN